MYDKSVKEGEDYNKLEKTIVILISDYELEGLKEIEKYITKWNIREEEYQKIILTDVMEVYIIELPKFEKYKDKSDNKLNLWMEFIEKSEVIDMNEDKETKDTIKMINKAKKVLEEISQDEHEIYLAELRQKYIMDQKAIEDAGYDKGLRDGIFQGKKENTIQIAKKMLIQKIDINLIKEITGLSIEEINQLKEF